MVKSNSWDKKWKYIDPRNHIQHRYGKVHTLHTYSSQGGWRQFVAFIRSYDTSYNQQSVTTINIVKAYKVKNMPYGATIVDKEARIVKEPQPKMSAATCSMTNAVQQVQEMKENVHVPSTADEGTSKKYKHSQIENFHSAKETRWPKWISFDCRQDS